MRFLTVWNIVIVASAVAILAFLCITAGVGPNSSLLAAVLYGEIWINDYPMIPYRLILGADVAVTMIALLIRQNSN